MEGIPHKPESFKNFKSSVWEIYKIDGWSENLNSLIGVWHNERQQETDLPGGTIEERVVFQMELAEIYMVTERYDRAFDTLEDAWVEANQEGLVGLVQKITDLMNHINSL